MKIIEIKNDNINHLSNKIIENGKKIEIFNKESTQKTKIIDELILIMSFILHPTDLFYKNGSILITKDKTLLKIINYQNPASIKCYAIEYNLFRIINGIGGLTFNL